jgi:hypothetical protein
MRRKGDSSKLILDFGFWILDFGVWSSGCRYSNNSIDPYNQNVLLGTFFALKLSAHLR